MREFTNDEYKELLQDAIDDGIVRNMTDAFVFGRGVGIVFTEE